MKAFSENKDIILREARDNLRMKKECGDLLEKNSFVNLGKRQEMGLSHI